MNSNVVVALITGGFTALVGVTGFGAAIYTNRKTISAGREERIRDKRAETYVDVLEYVSSASSMGPLARQWHGTGSGPGSVWP